MRSPFLSFFRPEFDEKEFTAVLEGLVDHYPGRVQRFEEEFRSFTEAADALARDSGTVILLEGQSPWPKLSCTPVGT